MAVVCFCVQSVPSGIPSLVAPKCTKMDLPTLKTDIPKYGYAGLGPITVQWWKAFVDMLECTMTAQEERSSSWLFSELVHLKQSSMSVTVPRALLPDQLTLRRQNENRSIPEVYMTGSFLV